VPSLSLWSFSPFPPLSRLSVSMTLDPGRRICLLESLDRDDAVSFGEAVLATLLPIV
jgi:hypothetical protein